MKILRLHGGLFRCSCQFEVETELNLKAEDSETTRK